MHKITILGAGSAFTNDLVIDFSQMDELDPLTLGLVDIDASRLDIAVRLTQKIASMTGRAWEIVASTDRKDVLPDSNFVINQIEVGGLNTVKLEYEIPLKYGIKQCIGDTLWPRWAIQDTAHAAGMAGDRSGHRGTVSELPNSQLYKSECQPLH